MKQKVNSYTDFFDDLNNIQNSIEDRIFKQIRHDWGYSTVMLRNWLNEYHSKEPVFNDEFGLDVNVFLPYKRKSLWFGSLAISRLELAIKAKAYIIFNNYRKLEDNELVFKIECLRQWLKIDSTKTKFSLNEFTKLTNDAREEAINNSEWLYDYLIEKQNNLTYTKKVYHYKKEDFDTVYPYMELKEAYEDWLNIRFPNIRIYYERERWNEFRNYCIEHNIKGDYREFKVEKLKKELKEFKIKKPSIRSFAKYLKQFNIPYKHKTVKTKLLTMPGPDSLFKCSEENYPGDQYKLFID